MSRVLYWLLVFRPTQEIFRRNQQVLEFDPRTQKKGYHLPIAAAMNVLPRGARNLSQDPSLEKFSDFFTIFRLYQILAEGGPKLMLVPSLDCSLNGPGRKDLNGRP